MQHAHVVVAARSSERPEAFRTRAALAAVALLAGVVAAATPAGAQTLNYVDFSSTAGLQINGSATQNGSKLRLTPAAFGQGGSAFSTTTIPLASNASFSTVFSFEIHGRGGLGGGADGITFTVQTNASNVGGAGGGIGYAGIDNSVAVEFDTFDNSEPGASNHVGVDVDGNMTSVATTGQLAPDFDDGNVWFAWVDYNGVTQSLETRWAQSSTRPVGSMLSTTLDLPTILGSPNVFVGFTSGTGAGWGEHNILSWNFVNRFEAGGAPLPSSTVPEPGTWALLGTGLLALGGIRLRRTRRTSA
jgi:hypothetical protein